MRPPEACSGKPKHAEPNDVVECGQCGMQRHSGAFSGVGGEPTGGAGCVRGVGGNRVRIPSKSKGIIPFHKAEAVTVEGENVVKGVESSALKVKQME